jgi:hypothetical protein
VRVGGRDHAVDLAPGEGARLGLTFEAPRASLVCAVRQRVFDDLLIGNFMRTTLHGTRDPTALYPHVTPYVAKYADNGEARSEEELAAYFAAYRRRAPLDFTRHRAEQRAVDVVRRALPRGSGRYRAARAVYRGALGSSRPSMRRWKSTGRATRAR